MNHDNFSALERRASRCERQQDTLLGRAPRPRVLSDSDSVSPSLQALCVLFLSLVLLMTSNHSRHLRSSGSFCVPMGVSDRTLSKALSFPKPTQSPFLSAILTSQTKELFLIRCTQSLFISQGPQGGFLVRTRNKWTFPVVSLFL